MTSVLAWTGLYTEMLMYEMRKPVRCPRELNALQLQKTHANRKSTSKLRKYLQFDSTCAANTHNTTKYRNALQNTNKCKYNNVVQIFTIRPNTETRCNTHNTTKNKNALQVAQTTMGGPQQCQNYSQQNEN